MIFVNVAFMRLRICYWAMYSKSESVEWISVEHPSKRKHRIKQFNELQNLAQVAPNSVDIYESGSVDTFYPQHPNELEECCL